MPHFSEHTADILFGIANWMLAGGALVVLVGAILVAWVTPMREEYSTAKVQAARNEAAAANERAGQAHERAAGLENEAAQAKLELAKLQERLAWRKLTPEQARKLADGLRGHHMSIELTWLASDPEAEAYAMQIADAMNRSQSISGSATPAIFTGSVFGLRISQTDTPEARILEKALRDADIPFTFSGSTPELRMSVGTKPMP